MSAGGGIFLFIIHFFKKGMRRSFVCHGNRYPPVTPSILPRKIHTKWVTALPPESFSGRFTQTAFDVGACGIEIIWGGRWGGGYARGIFLSFFFSV